MNLDHLTTLPSTMTGHIVSVETLPSGAERITIKPDEKFADRRYIGHSAEVIPPGTPVKPGYRVSFLPGSPTRKGQRPRAYRIEVLPKEDRN